MTHTVDLTPDPKVLLALTHTPLQPLDALCELIDNAIDSFTEAERSGNPIDFPIIVVELPGLSEVREGLGTIRVRDNGPGMSTENAERSLRAGFSGKKRFGSLGLFGMGFNIATGKLGQKTILTTMQRGSAPISIEVDLLKIVDSQSYDVPVSQVTVPPDFKHGTKIEISGWWSEGNANSGFIRKLIAYTKDKIRNELGRRYAVILSRNKIRISVNGEMSLP